MNHYLVFCLSVLLFFTACTGKSNSDEKSDKKYSDDLSSDRPAEVRAIPVKAEVFNYELVSNGTVEAGKKADLKFQSSDVVTNIYVKNGQRVAKGQKIAALDQFRLLRSFEQADDNFERAKLDLQDVLIGQGYSLNEPGKIPAEVLKIAKVKCNFEQSRISRELAEYNLKASVLHAPISGVVANLFTKENNIADGSQPFCRIVDTYHPDINFMVLESELVLVKIGDEVLVSPFSDKTIVSKGKIVEINPVVDKNGMVKVKAGIDNLQGVFYDGMNVTVRVQRSTDKQILIPKSALVLRDNRKVVFLAKNGFAQWVYVQTGLENSESYVVTEGLSQGDSVIYEGNFNLAHESPIMVK